MAQLGIIRDIHENILLVEKIRMTPLNYHRLGTIRIQRRELDFDHGDAVAIKTRDGRPVLSGTSFEFLLMLTASVLHLIFSSAVLTQKSGPEGIEFLPPLGALIAAATYLGYFRQLRKAKAEIGRDSEA